MCVIIMLSAATLSRPCLSFCTSGLWKSVLVRTGVFDTGAVNDPIDPADFVFENVGDAVAALYSTSIVGGESVYMQMRSRVTVYV